MKLRFDIEQNTEEWDAIKVGKFSASTAADLLMDKKNKGYISLIDKIVEERITGNKSESKAWSGNQFTERGHEFEPIARNDFELRTFRTAQIIGVIERDEWVLCSPDSLIDDNMLQQIKCPIFNTHKGYLKIYNKLRDEMTHNQIMYKISSTYYKQMQFELYVAEKKYRQYNIFTSYHPNLSALDLTIERDEDMIRDIDTRLTEAIKEVKEEIEFLKSLV
jgi:hypothetical protein